jgi:hypothetical protein
MKMWIFSQPDVLELPPPPPIAVIVEKVLFKPLAAVTWPTADPFPQAPTATE